jgi:hypothetical protein
MNDEYLWQKTGEDPEIAALEKALAVFRYREDAPPALTVQEESRPRRWRFVFAFASVAAIVVVAIVWMQSSKSVADDIVFVNESTLATPPPVQSPVTPIRNTGDTAAPKPQSRRDIIPTTAALTRRPKPKSPRPEPRLAALTEEERYAYGQLMLALSISSEKLKVVQDAINGVEPNKDSSPRNNNR